MASVIWRQIWAPAQSAYLLSKPLSQAANPPSSERSGSVLIVDDHTVVAEAIANLLRLQLGLEPSWVTSAQAAMALAGQQRFSAAILDLELSDGHGLEVAEALSREQPHCLLIVVSAHASSFYCPHAMRHRLTAVIDKRQAFKDLTAVLAPLLTRLPGGSTSDPLTEREQDVYRLIGHGLSCKQIANALGLAVRTVETHRKHIASKLGASGAELVHRATLDQERQPYRQPSPTVE